MQACSICGAPAPFISSDGDANSNPDWRCLEHTIRILSPPEAQAEALAQLAERVKRVAGFIRVHGRKPETNEEFAAGASVVAGIVTPKLDATLEVEVSKLENVARSLEDELWRLRVPTQPPQQQ